MAENAHPLARQRNPLLPLGLFTLPLRLLALPFLLLGQICEALDFPCLPFLTGLDVLFLKLCRFAALNGRRLSQPSDGFLQLHPMQQEALVTVLRFPLCGSY